MVLNMKILITGGMGFVGTHLAEELYKKNFDITIFDKNSSRHYFDFIPNNYNRIVGDIRDYNKVYQAAKNCDIIFHLAGVLGTDYLTKFPKLAINTNVIGTINVLRVAKKTGSIVLYLSLLPKWKNPYMITKNAAEKFCEHFIIEHKVKCIILRATHIYGKRQKWKPVKKAIPNFIISSLLDKTLTIYGTGEQVMDLLYIDDAVKGIMLIINRKELYGKSIEFGSGRGIKVREVAKKIILLCDSSSVIRYEKMRPGEPSSLDLHRAANIKKQREILRFTPEVDMNVGLKRTIEWYRDFLKMVKNDRKR